MLVLVSSEKLYDYVLYSFPLILLTFIACGLAISMLSADILQRIDVTDQVLSIVDQEIRPLIKMVTGEEEANPMYLMVAKMKVRGMLNTAVPAAKANLYAIGMAKLFVLEIGPLLTALLLAGRIGGSYAGKVDGDHETQVQAIETCIANGAKGILLTASDTASIVPVVQQARDAGLPFQSHEDRVAALFASGISTADVVTDLSGRGVGASAVLESVQAIGGHARITTSAGRGTRFDFTFPNPGETGLAA